MMPEGHPISEGDGPYFVGNRSFAPVKVGYASHSQALLGYAKRSEASLRLPSFAWLGKPSVARLSFAKLAFGKLRLLGLAKRSLAGKPAVGWLLWRGPQLLRNCGATVGGPPSEAHLRWAVATQQRSCCCATANAVATQQRSCGVATAWLWHLSAMPTASLRHVTQTSSMSVFLSFRLL